MGHELTIEVGDNAICHRSLTIAGRTFFKSGQTYTAGKIGKYCEGRCVEFVNEEGVRHPITFKRFSEWFSVVTNTKRSGIIQKLLFE